MIKCKFPSRYHPSSVLCAFLSQSSLKDQLLKSVDNRTNTPKTFPVEFKAASSPPVHRDDAKERCDRAVLKALAKANQNALKTGNVLLPFSKLHSAVIEKTVKKGTLLDVKRAGHELAEQFIMKYPESFKIRFSDKMSGDKLTYIEELCRDKKVVKAKQIYEEIVAEDCEYSMDKKKDVDALIDLFAFYNVSEDMVDWPVVYDEIKKSSEYEKRIKTDEGSTDVVTVELPYSRSLFKTLDVEQRNVDYIIMNLMRPDRMSNISPERKKKMINDIIGNEPPELFGSITTLYDDFRKSKNDKDHNMMYLNKEAVAMLPKESDTLYISVMDGTNSLALQALKYLREEGLVSGRNYDSVIQSAVRFHRPHLAWELYLEMRDQNLQPSTDTVTDLIYSITHSMPPDQFVREGAPVRIRRILTDLAENSTAKITDETFLNLFYGYHMVGYLNEESDSPGNEESAEEGGNAHKLQSEIDPEQRAFRDGIYKYNYHILNEMRECMIDGTFKMRYSTAYKILEMHNLTVGDYSKPYFTSHLNKSMLNLYDDHPELFIRDLEHDHCISFVSKLVSYARMGEEVFDVDSFYKKHRDDLIAMKKYTLLNHDSFQVSWSLLEGFIRFDLKTIKGQPLPEGMFKRLENVRPVNSIDFYNDFLKDNLEYIKVADARSVLDEMFKLVSCLNPSSADVDYVLGLYRMIIDENIKVSELCIKGNASNNEKIWTVNLFTFFEDFFNQFNAKYLVLFFLSEDSRRAPPPLPGEKSTVARKMELSEANIREVVNMTTNALKHLLEHEGVPTTIMVYVLIKFTLLSGAYEQAWKLLDIYNTYSIPLDDSPLLNYIELTPNWELDGERYLSSIAQPLQSSARVRIERMEREKKESTFQRYSYDQSSSPFQPSSCLH